MMERHFFVCFDMASRVHPGLLSLLDKKLNEATSPENDSDYVNPRLKNDILVSLYSLIQYRTKLRRTT